MIRLMAIVLIIVGVVGCCLVLSGVESGDGSLIFPVAALGGVVLMIWSHIRDIR